MELVWPGRICTDELVNQSVAELRASLDRLGANRLTVIAIPKRGHFLHVEPHAWLVWIESVPFSWVVLGFIAGWTAAAHFYRCS